MICFYLLFNSFTSAALPSENLSPKELDQFMYERNKSRDRGDSLNCRDFKDLKEGEKYEILGHIKYMDIQYGKYHYDVTIDNNQITLATKIFFRNTKNEKNQHDLQDLNETKLKVKWAQDYWNSQVPQGLNLQFQFLVIDNKGDAYFKPALIRKPIRGPYYGGWYTKWNKVIIAHEIGHMFGLDDEYENSMVAASTSLCDHSSLMCFQGINSSLKDYHFKTILGRIICL